MEPNKPMLSAPHLKTYLTKRISTVCTPTTTMWYTKYVAATKGTVALPMLFLPKTLDTLVEGREGGRNTTAGAGWNTAWCESPRAWTTKGMERTGDRAPGWHLRKVSKGCQASFSDGRAAPTDMCCWCSGGSSG